MSTLPKMLPGSLHLEWRRCGRKNCRCANAHPHGPYIVRRWREGGRQRKQLVPPERLLETIAAIEERRLLAPVSHIKHSLRSSGG